MKYLRILLAGLLFFNSIQTYATLNEVDKTQIFSKNLLVNGGFENGKAKWTASAGTFAVTTSSPMLGMYHATWDAAASANTLTTTAVTIPAGYYGRNGVVSCLITTASGTATHEIQAYDGSSILSETTVTSSTSPTRAVANFIFPSSGSISLRLYANADEPSIAIDDCYLGPAEGYNLGLAKPQDVFSALVSDGAGTTTVSNENVDWINGNCTNPGTGNYVCSFVSGTFSVAPNCFVQLINATSTNRSVLIPVTTTSSVEIFSRNQNANATADSDFYVVCQKTSTDALQPALRPDQRAQSWSGYHDNTCSWARTNAAYGAVTDDASCALVERTNSNFGTVSTSGSVSPAITFTPQRAGRYYACAYITISGATASANLAARLWDGTTVISEGESLGNATGRNYNIPLCGVYSASSTSAVTLTVQTKATGGAVTIATATATSAIEWSIFAIDNQFPAPLLVNSVVNSSSAVTTIEAANINCDAGSAITSQQGSWVSSVGNISSGACAITLLSRFASTPYCWAVSNNNAASQIMYVVASSATSVTVDCETSGAVACTSSDFNFFCMGPK